MRLRSVDCLEHRVTNDAMHDGMERINLHGGFVLHNFVCQLHLDGIIAAVYGRESANRAPCDEI